MIGALLGQAGTLPASPEAPGTPAAKCCAGPATVASTDPADQAGTGAVPQDGATEEAGEGAGHTPGGGEQPALALQPPTAALIAVADAPVVPQPAGRTVDTPVPEPHEADAAPATGPVGSASLTGRAPAGAAGHVLDPAAGDPARATTGTTTATADAGQHTAGSATPTGLTAVAGSTPAIAASTTGVPAPPEAASPVTGQVFPEVTRLVTRGDGTQRLTLRLSPDNLGEVRIVVTVRDGAVDVSLAAGAEAQEALRHGSPELRRLLESIGAVSTQIAVRDLPASPASAGQPPGAGSAHLDASGTGAQSRQDRADEQHHRKTPGGNDAAGPSPTPLRVPTDQTPATGVDLRL